MILSIVIYGQKKRREGRKLAKTARKNNTGANGMLGERILTVPKYVVKI